MTTDQLGYQIASALASLSRKEQTTLRYLDVARRLKLEAGVRQHMIRKSLSGLAHPFTGRIAAPEGRTRKQLYILAHECAHLELGHGGTRPRHIEEYEAEVWAHQALRRHGIPVPRSMTVRARKYVAHKIKQARARGAKHIDPAAERFATGGGSVDL